MIVHENFLLADNSHETSYLCFFFGKLGKMSQYLSSAAVVIGVLRVISSVDNHCKQFGPWSEIRTDRLSLLIWIQSVL